jgi:Asp-tRNA(Asn)/Glu-tRNA(Gln) amidotransferase B subunit
MIYTRHAVDQLKARFPSLITKDEAPKVTFHKVFSEAKETKRFLNNTNYLVYMLEKYGDCDCKYFENGDMVFIVRGETVVTVIDRNTPPFKGAVFRKEKSGGYRKTAA